MNHRGPETNITADELSSYCSDHHHCHCSVIVADYSCLFSGLIPGPDPGTDVRLNYYNSRLLQSAPRDGQRRGHK